MNRMRRGFAAGGNACTSRLAGTILLFCALAPILVASPGRASSAVNPSVDPHSSFRQPSQCRKCHRYDGQKIVPGRFAPASVDFCLECHLVDAWGPVHPFLVHPSAKFRDKGIPADYPLDDEGHVVCLTCHSAHGAFVSTVKAHRGQEPATPEPQAGGPLQYKTYFLRRTNPSEEGFEALCNGCHRSL